MRGTEAYVGGTTSSRPPPGEAGFSLLLQMHRRLLLLTRDTRLPLAITIAAGLLAGLLTIVQAYALSAAVSAVFLKGQTLAEVWPWLRLLLFVMIGRGFLVWVSETAASSTAVRVKSGLRERLLAHILALGPAYTRGEQTGELTAAAVEGIEALDAYFSQYLPQVVISALVPASILAIVFPLDPLSGLVLLLTAPLIPFFMYMIGRGAEVATTRQYKTLGRLSAYFLDSLQGLTTLKLFGQSKAQARNIAAASDQYRDVTLKVLQITFLSAFALELLATISTAIIAVEVGLRLLYGHMQFQQALWLLILAPEFYLPLRMLGLRFHAGMAGTSAAKRIFQILDIGALERTSGLEPEAANSDSAATATRFSSLEAANVSYVYPGEHEPALENISINIKAGRHIALVGATGAGKSTLVSLLLRFMEPTGGQILLNGTPSCRIRIEHWRDLIAWVPQDAHLFHDTIAANLRLGKPNASEAEMKAAADAAHLGEFIQALPDGWQTVIGEGGARLSSGEAQRLALARAFLKNAGILIMDEPTSSLDPETEALLEDSTRRLMAGRTVITIAHRLNTVARADQIIVLDRGHIAESGTHQQLLRRDGLYARMARAHAGKGSPTAVRGIGLLARTASSSRAASPSSSAEATHNSIVETRSIFTRLASFLRGSWGWVALSVALASLTIGASVALMGTSSSLISMAALHPSVAALEVAIVGVRFFGIARAVFRYLERLVSHNVTFRLLGRLRTWFYETLEPLAPARLMQYRAGDLLARIVGDVNTLESFYVRVLLPPATAMLVCVGVSAFLGFLDPPLSLLLPAGFLLAGAAVPALIQRASSEPGARSVALRAELQAQLVDGIQGLPDILAFGRGPDRLEQIRSIGREFGNAQLRLASIGGAQGALMSLATNLTGWLLLCLAIPEVLSGHIAGVMLAALVLAALSSFEAVMPLPVAAQVWSSSRPAASRLFELVDAEPAVTDTGRRRLEIPEGSRSRARRAGMVLEVSKLSFTYPREKQPALQDIDFKLQARHSLAIVGHSGAGKSTLANVLLRFWDFSCGEVRLGGRPIREYSLEDVRDCVAVISPDTHFFNTTVYENLRMARRGATREQVEAAAAAAQIHDRILKLPHGYDTQIGEQGLRLSGGERQRMAIARAILKDAPFLLLDEPTADLDALTEAQVLQALFGLMEHKTSLLITHRLVGLGQVDEILVLEHGRVVEHGTQAALLRRKGAFRRLWDLQNRLLTAP